MADSVVAFKNGLDKILMDKDIQDDAQPLHSSYTQVSTAPTLLLYTGRSLSQHNVHDTPDALIRTQGSAVSIWCNASGHTVGGFEWSMFPAHSPTQKMQIVSSVDPHFSYTIYRDRVRVRREIYLESVGDDASRLHITHLRAQDAGEYECYAPNTAYSYYGGYSTSVSLTVIPDLLRVRLLSPEELTLHEDDSLTMTCEVSSGTRQHIHFSVTWYQRHTDSTQSVLSLSKQSVVSAGPTFLGRQQAGEMRLEKVSATWYQLTVYRLQASDQAEYYCQASEWIQDPDNSWYPLTTKRSRAAKVQLHSPEMMSPVHSSAIRRAPIFLLQLPLLAWTAYCSAP
ncbi:immunoglobulin superfamily member 3-like [Pseudophryne corroboree]|uniref:immunoglobulin superfamily member 3-like n=1 Tax=Pseudophryne corroboree TaxID=495146 RepID=UPI0030820B3F